MKREDWRIGKEHPTALGSRFVPLEFQDDVVFGRYQDKFLLSWYARAFIIDGTSSTLERVLPIPPQPAVLHWNVMMTDTGRPKLHGPYDTEELAIRTGRENNQRPHKYLKTVSITL